MRGKIIANHSWHASVPPASSNLNGLSILKKKKKSREGSRRKSEAYSASLSWFRVHTPPSLRPPIRWAWSDPSEGHSA
jgi:hypothetical protein